LDIAALAFTVINYIRELIAQKLDDNGIHFLYARKFCRRPTSEVSFGWTCCVGVHQKRVNTVYAQS